MYLCSPTHPNFRVGTSVFFPLLSYLLYFPLVHFHFLSSLVHGQNGWFCLWFPPRPDEPPWARGCKPQQWVGGCQLRMICHLQTLEWLVRLVRCAIYIAGLGYKCNIPVFRPFRPPTVMFGTTKAAHLANADASGGLKESFILYRKWNNLKSK